LHENPPPEQPGRHPFELNGLLSRETRLPTDPADGIKDARVIKMRLSIGNGRRKITLDADPDGTVDDIYQMLETYIDRGRLTDSKVNVTQAKFLFRFVGLGGKAAKNLAFEVSFPNAANLKNQPEERRLLAEKYLKRWGIDRG
jgi:hypothetical protein